MVADQQVGGLCLESADHGLADLVTDGHALHAALRIAELQADGIPAGGLPKGRAAVEAGEQLRDARHGRHDSLRLH